MLREFTEVILNYSKYGSQKGSNNKHWELPFPSTNIQKEKKPH